MQNNLDLELKSIQIQNERLLRELAEVHKMLEKPEQQPMFSVFIAGRLAFPREEVMKWLKVSDADYLEYAKECGVTAIPEKYVRLSQKARQKEEIAV